ncbi:unnamed protein product [Staurois parvus]|uniref:Uncharacterized protein n=1 Tax=Staurois parvus TaxID=386267 RepID=A0ABN9G2N3_9NEOB|nr:unnamed protein product [Staurois parvus]
MYVKCIETAMTAKMKFFKKFQRRTSRRHRDRKTEAGCRHRPEEMAGDAAADTS